MWSMRLFPFLGLGLSMMLSLATATDNYVVNIDIVGAPVNFDSSSLISALSSAASSVSASNASLSGFVSTDADISLSNIQTCSAGYYCPGNVAPQPCPIGTYNPNTGKTSLDACLNCSQKNPNLYCGLGSAQPGLCDDGSYLLNGQCIICPAGGFCNTQSPYASQPCAAGTYLDTTGGTSQASCKACTVGNYCIEGSSTPAQCPAGKYMPDTGAQSAGSCLQCQQGYYCAGTGLTAMTACPAGTYNDKFQSSLPTDCSPCTAGYGSASGSKICSRIAETPPGSYIANGQVQLCPVGTYKDAVGNTQCKSCESGLYCAAGSTGGVPCASGYFLDNSDNLQKCSLCPAGKFCENNGIVSATPTVCAAGTFNANTGGTSQASCSDCPPGTYCPANPAGISTTTPCAAGYINTGTRQIVACTTPCPAGSYCPTGSSVGTPCLGGSFRNSTGAAAQSDCTQCNVGDICPAGSTFKITPAQCPIGSYCPSTSNTNVPCPEGTYGNSTGLTSVTQCTTCSVGLYCAGGATKPAACAAGYYVSGTACVACPAGSFCVSIPPYAPQQCAAGSYRGTTGGSSCNPCVAGAYCLQGATAPTFCGVGYYSSATSATTAGTCGACPAGSYCSSRSSTSATTQTICPAGSYCPEGANVPQPCPPGKFLNTTGASLLTQCRSCPAGYYCGDITGTSMPTPAPAGTYISQEGASAPYTPGDTNYAFGGNCTAGKICAVGATLPVAITECPPGSYCDASSSLPIPCPLYTYKNTTGPLQSACVMCPAGTYCGDTTGRVTPGTCPLGSYVTATATQQTCNTCPRGSYCANNVKYDCPAGTYLSDYGKASVTDCAPCPAGGYCLAASFSSTSCKAGTYNPSLNAFSSAACIPCTAGNYCPAGSSSGNPCLAGTLSTAVGNSVPGNCTACPTGNYCPAGSTAPTQCLPGTYRPIPSAGAPGECQKCDAGSYCLAGATNPTACKGNTFSEAGQKSELGCRCMPGFFCTYTEHITATISVKGSMAAFQNNTGGVRDQFIAAIAQAAGNIPIANVVITGVSPRVGNRRLLSSGGDDDEYFTVHAVIRNGKQLRDLHKHMRLHVGDTLVAQEWSVAQGGTTKPTLLAADANGRVNLLAAA